MRQIKIFLSAMVLFLLLLPLPLSISDSKEGGSLPEYAPGEIIVKLKAGASIDSTDYLFSKHKVAKIEKVLEKVGEDSENAEIDSFKKHGLDRVFVLKSYKYANVEEMIEDFKSDPNVEYAEPNYIVSIDLIPNDPSFSQLWGLHNTGQGGGTFDADIDAPEAWEMQTGNSGVVIAVIDTGADYTHEDLAANIWANPGETPSNGIDDDLNGFIDDVRGWDFANNDNNPFDDHGHGTHVSGTIGAVGNNNVGVVGVAWNVSILPLKFLNSAGSGTTAGAISAIEYATLIGVDVMSNSWGGGGFSQALMDAIAAANDAGILFVAAAGNSNVDTDATPHYPSSYNVPNVVAVAATDRNDLKAAFSNFGATSVDLGAPGVSIFSTVPTGVCSLCDASGYAFLSGTSMATPHVSGAAAIIKAQFPTTTVAQLKSRLLNSVDALASLNGITVTGGRLNVFNALEVDTTPPSAITDLTATNPTSGSVSLSWTAVGDDGILGNASSYDLRYSTLPINETNFESATKASNTPKPQASGSAEVFTVTGLLSSTTYFFAIKAVDNVGNKGDISNIASQTTAQAQTSLIDDFDPQIDFTQWSSISLGAASTACGSVSGNALYFNGVGIREARTNNLDVSGGGTINFFLKIGTGGAPCENADAGEDVVLQYSVDGGLSWSNIKTYNQNSFASFTNIAENVPIAAQSVHTMFRWLQPIHSAGNFDNWAIDSVSIISSAPDTTPPVISNVNIGNITTNSAIINWKTDELSDSRVDFGLNTSYGLVALSPTLVINHGLMLTGLSAATTYHFQVTSKDAANNSASAGDFNFTTLAPPTLTSISVTPANASIQEGSTQQYTATGIFSDGSTQNLTNTVIWSSSNTTVATISAFGLANALLSGNTTISATSGAIIGSTTLTVTAPLPPPTLVSIAVTPVNPSREAGSTQQFTASGTLSNGSVIDLTNTATWSSSNITVATISASGLASALAAGTTTISATAEAIVGSTTLTVTAPAPPPSDVVTITLAQFKVKAKELRVGATSTNPTATLTVAGYGVMTNKGGGNYEFRKRNVPDPGATITVTSSSGGSATAPVQHI